MTVALSEIKDGKVFLLKDYSTLSEFWRVRAEGDGPVIIAKTERVNGEPIHGLLDKWRLGRRKATMAIFSSCSREDIPTAPDYAKNLQILIDGRLLGDNIAMPKIEFRKTFLSRKFIAKTCNGWVFEVHYGAPWIRDLFRKFNLGGTLEYDPVDFVERLIEIVKLNRPEWLAVEPDF